MKFQFRKWYHLCRFPFSLFQCWWFQWQPHSWFCWWILWLLCRPGVLSNLCNLVTGKGDTIPHKGELRRTTLFSKQIDIQHRRYHASYITLLDVKLIKLNPPPWTGLSWFFYLSWLIILLCTEDIHTNSQMFAPGRAVCECKQSPYSLLCSLYHMHYKKHDPHCVC